MASNGTPEPIRGNRVLKLLDRYAGIPLVTLLGLRRRRRIPADPRRIGLMKTAAIGDTLLLAGLVQDVRRAFPHATLVAITGADNRAATTLLGGFDETVLVSARAFPRSVAALRAARLDVLVDFGSWPRFDAALAALSGARCTAGFETPGQHRGSVYDLAVPHSRDRHERDNYARLLKTIGVQATTDPSIAAPNALAPDRIPRDAFVVVHPWSAGYMREVKEWRRDRWVDLATRLSAMGRSVLVSGGPHDANASEALAAAMRENGAAASSIAGRFSLLELADVLAASDGVVAVNTGIAHLASLVGARTVSLEGPTPPLRWRPLGPRTRTVVTSYPNCGYLNLGFEYDGQRLDCMDGISVDAVVAALDDLRGDAIDR